MTLSLEVDILSWRQTPLPLFMTETLGLLCS